MSAKNKNPRNDKGRFVSSTKEEYSLKFMENVLILESGCWEWTACKNKRGYGKFYISTKFGAIISAHRAAYYLFVGELPKGMLVCHICDNTSCVNPDHLFLGTNADNMKDRDNKERQARGERQTASKLTESDVVEMRRLNSEENISYSELGRRFGVTNVLARLVCIRKAWKHVQ